LASPLPGDQRRCGGLSRQDLGEAVPLLKGVTLKFGVPWVYMWICLGLGFLLALLLFVISAKADGSRVTALKEESEMAKIERRQRKKEERDQRERDLEEQNEYKVAHAPFDYKLEYP
jgi:hypothetical protein